MGSRWGSHHTGAETPSFPSVGQGHGPLFMAWLACLWRTLQVCSEHRALLFLQREFNHVFAMDSSCFFLPGFPLNNFERKEVSGSRYWSRSRWMNTTNASGQWAPSQTSWILNIVPGRRELSSVQWWVHRGVKRVTWSTERFQIPRYFLCVNCPWRIPLCPGSWGLLWWLSC